MDYKVTDYIYCRTCKLSGSPQSTRRMINGNFGKQCEACGSERQSKLQIQVELEAQAESKEAQLKATKEPEEMIVEEHQRDPIRQLPLEVALQIFRFTIPDHVEESRYHIPWRISAPTVLTLSAVCRAWRQIAWSSPRLWTTVTLTLHSKLTTNKIDVVEKWLERSIPLPLFIRLDVKDKRNRPDDENRSNFDETWPIYRAFVDVFNRHSARWQTLCVQCPNWLSGLFTGSSDGSPLLKTLQLILRSRDDRYTRTTFELRGPKPQPSHVVAVGYRQLTSVGISWDNVLDATVDYLLLSDCIHLLTIAPKLVSLHIQNVQDLHHDIQTHATHHQLRTLDIILGDKVYPTHCEKPFDNIDLPSLENLGIHGDIFYLHLPSNSIIAFLHRSFCPLVTLRLDKTSCNEQELLDILYALPPSIENIELDTILNPPSLTDHNLPVLFSHLGCTSTPSTTDRVPRWSLLLPNLETFKLYVYKATKMPWDLLPNLLRPGFGRKRPLKELTIVQRDRYESVPPLLFDKGQRLEKNVIDGLIKMKDDGVELFLPRKISLQDLWALEE